MEIVRAENLSFSYPLSEEKIFDNISFSVNEGEFVLLSGLSGCGKTTLLRHLKPSVCPHGERGGKIFFMGKEELSRREECTSIGYVGQSPENGIVTDKVWHELGFGLESLGFPSDVIRLKVAEMASFFGIEQWFYSDVSTLSGGQKQILNLASVMAMSPSLLILDEPTSRLDPITAAEFLAMCGKINRELGTTIIMTEHRFEEVLPLSSRMMVLHQGGIIVNSLPRLAIKELAKMHHPLFLSMPTPSRVYEAVPSEFEAPLTVGEGRHWLALINEQKPLLPLEQDDISTVGEIVLELKDIWFRYDKESRDILKGLSLTADKGKMLAILGGNGVGKSTTLSIIAGQKTPQRGTCKIASSNNRHLKIALLAQNPQVLFLKSTVGDDLAEIATELPLNKSDRAARVRHLASICRLHHLWDRHPYDLSGGEQQRLALAKVLMTNPDILLLDEPTKGLDGQFKEELAEILKGLMTSGVTIITVSHDIEFCAKYADRCALMFDGKIVSSGRPREFFSQNTFYTTSANRMSRSIIKNAITDDDIIKSLGITPPSKGQKITQSPILSPKKMEEEKPSPINKAAAIFSAICFVFALLFGLLSIGDLSEMVKGGQLEFITRYIAIVSSLLLFGTVFLTCLLGAKNGGISVSNIRKKRTKGTALLTIATLIAASLTIYLGITFFEGRRYYFISMLLIFECMLPFALTFEWRKPPARELVIIAVLCSLAVIGRLVFFMVPQFKPMIGIVIIAAIAFGGQTGFLVGATSAFASNFFFGQGPWTPWQMLAVALIGLIAGTIFHRGKQRKSLLAITLYGALSTFFVYGFLMNSYTALSISSGEEISVFLTTFAFAFVFDLIHALATAIFLTILTSPLLEKFERIKLKYGFID